MLMMEFRKLNTCAGGNVQNLYLEDVWRLIEDNANQVRYLITLGNGLARSARQVDVSGEIQELNNMMLKLMVAQTDKAKVCEFRKGSDHKTNKCPTLFEELET